MTTPGLTTRGTQSSAARGQTPIDTHGTGAPGHPANDTQGAPARGDAHPQAAYDVLRACADQLDQIEAARIAAEGRLRDLKQKQDRPRMLRHLTIAEDAVASLKAVERGCELELERAMREHPLGGFVMATKGLGLKQTARLLAATGDPTWNTADDRPRRGPAEFWAYCGYDPKQKRQRGQKSNWNATAKSRAFLIAESCIKKDDSPYRVVYDNARLKAAGAVHAAPCARCGPKGKPAPEGSPISAGHAHARGLREVAKAVLRDLWRVGNGMAPRTINDAAPIEEASGAMPAPTSSVAAPRAKLPAPPTSRTPGADSSAPTKPDAAPMVAPSARDREAVPA